MNILRKFRLVQVLILHLSQHHLQKLQQKLQHKSSKSQSSSSKSQSSSSKSQTSNSINTNSNQKSSQNTSGPEEVTELNESNETYDVEEVLSSDNNHEKDNESFFNVTNILLLFGAFIIGFISMVLIFKYK